MISSVHNSQVDAIQAISKLYIGERFHLDPTYSKGIIHKSLMDPELKSDLATGQDCRSLPYLPNFIRSIMFDPPFLAGGGPTGIMHERFSSYPTVKSLLEFYNESLKEFHRVLIKNGYLVFKCQDLCNGRTQTFSHCEIYSMALANGFYARDLFVLTKLNRAKPHNMKEQTHARKFHSYFWVFQKCGKNNVKSS